MAINTRTQFYLIVLIGFAICATSCSISFEKRRYRPGYHVELSQQNKNKRPHQDLINVSETKNSTVFFAASPNKVLKTKAQTNPVLLHYPEAKTDSVKPVLMNKIVEKKKVIKNDGCDLLVLKDGVHMEVIVLEITETEIKYKKCNYIDGPTYIIPTTKVEVIHLKNGDFYRPNPNNTSSNTNDDKRKMNNFLEATIFMAILAICSAVLAFIFAFIPLFAPIYIFRTIGVIIASFSMIESLIAVGLGIGGLKFKDHRATNSIIIGAAAFILSIVAIVLSVL